MHAAFTYNSTHELVYACFATNENRRIILSFKNINFIKKFKDSCNIVHKNNWKSFVKFVNNLFK